MARASPDPDSLRRNNRFLSRWSGTYCFQHPHIPDSPFVIPGKVKGRPMRNLNDPWEVVCESAGLTDMRIHDCRHSYASRALALGE